jgi:hypothetical protein
MAQMAQHEKLDEEIEKVFEELQETSSLVLRYQNMEKLTLWYRKAHGIRSDQLADTLAEMHAGGWRCDQEVLTGGIPQVYYDQFTEMVHGKSIYTAEFFLSMRVQPEYA